MLDPAERIVLRVDTAKAAQYGIPANEVAHIARIALAGEDVTPLHDGSSKYAVPVRIGLADAAKGSMEALLKLKVRGPDTVRDEQTGLPYEIPLSELVRPTTLPREHVLHRKDLQPVVYVTGDVAGGAGKTDSPLYGMFTMRAGHREDQLRRADCRWQNAGSPRRWIAMRRSRSNGTASGRSPTKPSATWASPMPSGWY